MLDNPESKNLSNENLLVEGQEFRYVKSREYDPVSVYKGDGVFLRLGERRILEPEMQLHRKFISSGFPVAEVLSAGEHQDKFYYTERSLGERPFGHEFWHDCVEAGRISDEHFKNFLQVTRDFATAQLGATGEKNEESFFHGTHFDILTEEQPELKPLLTSVFDRIKKRTVNLPYVLTHGDLNPYNELEGGVIDFGSAFYGPIGYDLNFSVAQTYNFPPHNGSERWRRFQFTPEQLKEYFTFADDFYQENSLPKLTEHSSDFLAAEMVWSVARGGNNPKLHEWRLTKLKKLLGDYLAGQDLAESFFQ